MVQNVAGLCHLKHKCRLTSGQVITSTDTGHDAVNRSNQRAAGRNVAADISKQDNQGILAHVGRLASHIGAGDNQHAALRVKIKVIRLESLFTHRFHNRVTATLNMQA